MDAELEHMRMIVESAFAARFLVSGDDRILYVNQAAEEMFGYRAEELVGGTVDVLVPQPVRPGHAQLRNGFLDDPRRVMIGVDREIHGLRKNGTEFPIQVGLAPIKTDDGRLYVAVTIFDISHHKEIERQLVERARELGLANDRLARFAYIASHDLQEPLRKIAAFAEVIKAALANGNVGEADRASDVVRMSALRARELVEGLLTYSRHVSTPLELEELNVKEEIEAVVADFSELIRQTNAKIAIRIPPAAKVLADKPQFVRCMFNLLSNAIKYRKPGRDLEIVFEAGDEADFQLSVADNGIGFEPKYAEVIFEPLKRLHSFSQYPGAGIGLALCKSMCERHGWRLEAQSQLDLGATFTLTIPIAKAPPGAQERSRRLAPR
ncbi:MAG: PAS domain-containing sensor histidine kinase [Methylocystaceae bacterium]|nr:MAG: PAS domain-containing sensor histidine kinase [Methylocystaceae bacterium]